MSDHHQVTEGLAHLAVDAPRTGPYRWPDIEPLDEDMLLEDRLEHEAMWAERPTLLELTDEEASERVVEMAGDLQEGDGRDAPVAKQMLALRMGMALKRVERPLSLSSWNYVYRMLDTIRPEDIRVHFKMYLDLDLFDTYTIAELFRWLDDEAIKEDIDDYSPDRVRWYLERLLVRPYPVPPSGFQAGLHAYLDIGFFPDDVLAHVFGTSDRDAIKEAAAGIPDEDLVAFSNSLHAWKFRLHPDAGPMTHADHAAFHAAKTAVLAFMWHEVRNPLGLREWTAADYARGISGIKVIDGINVYTPPKPHHLVRRVPEVNDVNDASSSTDNVMD